MPGLWPGLIWQKLERQHMSNGVLIAAFDSVTDQNQLLGYRALAQINAALIRKHLQLPVAVITDQPIDGFDCVILVDPPAGNSRHVRVGDIHQNYIWRNHVRTQAGNLTPWDRTLMLDADCLIQTDFFTSVFETDFDFMLVKNVLDISKSHNSDVDQMMLNFSIPQWWATAMYWKGSGKTYFDYAQMIADNYAFYAGVFGFNSQQFRNDMVFSIVAHMLPVQPFPGSLKIASGNLQLMSADSRGLLFIDDNNCRIRIHNTDVHVINKNITTQPRLDLLQEYAA